MSYHLSPTRLDIDGRHLHTTSLLRLQWSWIQCHHSITSLPPLEPPLQTFETEIIWFLYLYKHPKNTQYSLPIPMLDHLLTTFNITHTYFSSPLTCSTLLKQFYSFFPRHCKFGFLSIAFSHKWNGMDIHPPPTFILISNHTYSLTCSKGRSPFIYHTYQYRSQLAPIY
jgi:hypothetical protein